MFSCLPFGRTLRWRNNLLQLQRGWNSRSCSNVNRVAKTPVPTSTSGTMAATLCRPPPSIPSPPLEAPNTSTLPYIRNFYNNSSPVISNLTKSASTWGPLHKPLHWKVRSSLCLFFFFRINILYPKVQLLSSISIIFQITSLTTWYFQLKYIAMIVITQIFISIIFNITISKSHVDFVIYILSILLHS